MSQSLDQDPTFPHPYMGKILQASPIHAALLSMASLSGPVSSASSLGTSSLHLLTKDKKKKAFLSREAMPGSGNSIIGGGKGEGIPKMQGTAPSHLGKGHVRGGKSPIAHGKSGQISSKKKKKRKREQEDCHEHSSTLDLGDDDGPAGSPFAKFFQMAKRQKYDETPSSNSTEGGHNNAKPPGKGGLMQSKKREESGGAGGQKNKAKPHDVKQHSQHEKKAERKSATDDPSSIRNRPMESNKHNNNSPTADSPLGASHNFKSPSSTTSHKQAKPDNPSQRSPYESQQPKMFAAQQQQQQHADHQQHHKNPAHASHQHQQAALERKREPTDGAQNQSKGGAIPWHPFQTEYGDHFETSDSAYADVAPLLAQLAKCMGKKSATLSIYDPYYCAGSVIQRLSELGFKDVYNKNEDCYAVWREKRAPLHDVVVTNPPFSGDHKERCLRHCVESGRPWACVLPNYCATKEYFQRITQPCADGLFFGVPKAQYEFEHPEGTGHASSPFFSLWFFYFGKHSKDILKWYRQHHGARVYACTHMCLFMCACMCICIYTRFERGFEVVSSASWCVYVCMHVYRCVTVCVCARARVCVYVYIHDSKDIFSGVARSMVRVRIYAYTWLCICV